MSFDVRDDTEIAGLWFMDAGGTEKFDWLCQVYKQGSKGKWRFKYRFRYHRPDPKKDPFNDDDEKSWTAGSALDGGDESKKKLVESVRSIACALEKASGGKLDETLDVGMGAEALMAVMKNKEWAHVKSGIDMGSAGKVADA